MGLFILLTEQRRGRVGISDKESRAQKPPGSDLGWQPVRERPWHPPPRLSQDRSRQLRWPAEAPSPPGEMGASLQRDA